MTALSRWLAPATLAIGLGFGAMAPVQAQSQDELVRVLVNVADVVFRGNTPYYGQGNYAQDDRLIMQRDRYGRPVYYRTVPRDQYYGNDGSYNNYGYGNNGYANNQGYGNNGYGNNDGNRRVKCNKHGKCKVEYYDPRYSQHPHNDRNNHDNLARHDQDGRYWDGRQWRYRNSGRDRDHEEHDRRDHDDDD